MRLPDCLFHVEPPFTFGETSMKTLCGPAVLLVLALSLVGCGGNYRFDDHQYRPLGDPQALERGQR
jgi:hypothetical protein